MEGKNGGALEDIDTRRLEHPDHQPNRNPGDHNVTKPFSRGLRLSAVGHIFLYLV